MNITGRTGDVVAHAPFIVTPDRAPRPLAVVGEEITVLAAGAQTGSYEIFRQVGPEEAARPHTATRGTRRST